MGHRPDPNRQPAHLLPSRRAGPQPDRSDPLAWRRGAGGARRLRLVRHGRARCPARIPGVPLMLKTITAIVLAAFFTGTAVHAQEETGRPVLDAAKVRAVVANAVDDFIRPSYRDFHTAAGKLATGMQDLCAAPSPETLQSAREAFAEAAAHWARIEIVRTGPALAENRLERILFYPDRKSTGLKQVQALLAEPDEAATDIANLPGKSVAMQS